jgi:hypothetical protein
MRCVKRLGRKAELGCSVQFSSGGSLSLSQSVVQVQVSSGPGFTSRD